MVGKEKGGKEKGGAVNVVVAILERRKEKGRRRKQKGGRREGVGVSMNLSKV